MSRVYAPSPKNGQYVPQVDTSGNFRLAVNDEPWRGDDRHQVKAARRSKRMAAPQGSPWYTPKGAYIMFQDKFQPGSIKGSIFTLVVAIVGAGTLSLPKAFQAVGILPAITILALGGVIAYSSLRALVISSKYLPSGVSSSYRSLAQQSMGSCGAVFSQMLLMMNLFGTTVSYIVASGEITHICFSAIAEAAHAGHIWIDNKTYIMIGVTVLVIFPLSLCRDMSSLRFTSLLGVACSTYLAIIIMVKYFQYCIQGIGGTVCFWKPAWNSGELYDLTYDGLMVAFPLVVYGYTCHPNVLPLYLELQRRSPRRMYKVTRRSLGIAFTVYLVAGVGGFLTFAGLTQTCDKSTKKTSIGVCGNILKNDYHLNISMIVAAALVAVSATLTVPLFAHAFRYNMAKLIYGCGSQTEGWKNADPALLDESDSYLGTTREPEMSDPDRLPRWLHVLITLVMLGAALVIAIVVSDISIVFGILGSTTNPLICYLLPTIFFLRLVPKGKAKYTKCGLVIMTILVIGLSGCAFVGQIQNIIANNK